MADEQDRSEAAAVRAEGAASRGEQAAGEASKASTTAKEAVAEMTKLRGQLNALSDQMKDLPSREELEERLGDQQDALEYNRKRGLAGLYVIGGIAMVAIMTVVIIFGVGNLRNGNVNRDNSNRLVECTTPGLEKRDSDPFFTGHKCYDDSSKRIANAVKGAVGGTIAVEQCVAEGTRAVDLPACVLHKLTAAGVVLPAN